MRSAARDRNLFTRIIEPLGDPIQVEHAWTANHPQFRHGVAGRSRTADSTRAELPVRLQRYASGGHAGSREARQTIEKHAAIHDDTPKRGAIPQLCHSHATVCIARSNRTAESTTSWSFSSNPSDGRHATVDLAHSGQCTRLGPPRAHWRFSVNPSIWKRTFALRCAVFQGAFSGHHPPDVG
jgi:hypothetical protein